MLMDVDRSVHIHTDFVNFGYDISRYTTTKYDLHCHNFYEMYFFMEGDVDYLVEGRKYKPTPNSLLLLAPHVFHGVRINTDRPYRRFSLHFHPDVLSADRRNFLLSAYSAFEKNEKQNIYYENTNRMHLQYYFEAVRDCAQQSEEGQKIMLPICIEALLGRIIIMSGRYSSAENISFGTVQQVIWYLNQHLSEPISLDMLSECFFISKYHLNKIFKRATGTTVFNYLLHKRVIAAQQLLIDGCSAQEAALASGFQDYSSFYRSYTRILGHSPIKDRGVLPSLNGSDMESLKK